MATSETETFSSTNPQTKIPKITLAPLLGPNSFIYMRETWLALILFEFLDHVDYGYILDFFSCTKGLDRNPPNRIGPHMDTKINLFT